MERYRNQHGDSGVRAYRIGPDWIEVRFRGADRPYRYSYRSAGCALVERMKTLAQAGQGLSTFISQHAHDAYER